MENTIQTEATITAGNVTTSDVPPTLSAENVTAFIQKNPNILKDVLGQDFAKPILQPVLDSHFSKSLDTWKGNNLDGLVEAKVAELYPEETPESKQLRQMQSQITQMQNEKRMSELEVIKRDVLDGQGLNTTFSKFLVGDSEEAIMASAVELKSLLANQVQQGVDARFKKEAHVPQAQTPEQASVNVDEIRKLSYVQKLELKRNNPKLYAEYEKSLLG